MHKCFLPAIYAFHHPVAIWCIGGRRNCGVHSRASILASIEQPPLLPPSATSPSHSSAGARVAPPSPRDKTCGFHLHLMSSLPFGQFVTGRLAQHFVEEAISQNGGLVRVLIPAAMWPLLPPSSISRMRKPDSRSLLWVPPPPAKEEVLPDYPESRRELQRQTAK